MACIVKTADYLSEVASFEGTKVGETRGLGVCVAVEEVDSKVFFEDLGVGGY